MENINCYTQFNLPIEAEAYSPYHRQQQHFLMEQMMCLQVPYEAYQNFQGNQQGYNDGTHNTNLEQARLYFHEQKEVDDSKFEKIQRLSSSVVDPDKEATDDHKYEAFRKHLNENLRYFNLNGLQAKGFFLSGNVSKKTKRFQESRST
ncbi:unnamed protein product [Ceutorhynchus assimilis]|uniref:Uncharacterized protein n=1 Tax=Ceutorhynchus assimilis TaxID=467358 RepID=A0A9N9MUT2_9CUCU|nr:unnamed protein product [Ceutorhynchus assimilis]